MKEKMTKAEFAEIVGRIVGYFKDFEISEAAFDLWYEQMKGADFEHVKRGVDAYARASRYEPTLADLIKYTSAEYDKDGKIGVEVTERYIRLTNNFPFLIRDAKERSEYDRKCNELFRRRTVGTYGFTAEAVRVAEWIFKRGILQMQMVDEKEREFTPFYEWLEGLEIE